MKKIVAILFIVIMSNYSIAQKSSNLNGKIFQLIDQIPNSTTDLMFISNSEVVYVITNVFNGKTYVDECPGKTTFINNKLTINCICKDKEIYPDPIKDSFIYNPKSQTLTSTIYKSVDGKYFVWEMK
jgi:hypothetical protein